MNVDVKTIEKLFGEQMRSLPVMKRTIVVGGKPIWIQEYSLK